MSDRVRYKVKCETDKAYDKVMHHFGHLSILHNSNRRYVVFDFTPNGAMATTFDSWDGVTYEPEQQHSPDAGDVQKPEWAKGVDLPDHMFTIFPKVDIHAYRHDPVGMTLRIPVEYVLDERRPERIEDEEIAAMANEWLAWDALQELFSALVWTQGLGQQIKDSKHSSLRMDVSKKREVLLLTLCSAGRVLCTIEDDDHTITFIGEEDRPDKGVNIQGLGCSLEDAWSLINCVVERWEDKKLKHKQNAFG